MVPVRLLGMGRWRGKMVLEGREGGWSRRWRVKDDDADAMDCSTCLRCICVSPFEDPFTRLIYFY